MTDDTDGAGARPLAWVEYQRIADAFDAESARNLFNAEYERPATRSLVPDVGGAHVLELGCGPGHYTRWLLDRGATVLAVDGSERMLEIARRRIGARASFVLANLEAPLGFAADAGFDGVLAPLCLDYVRDWTPLFREVARTLRPGGWFVYSVGHPFVELELSETGAYRETELVRFTWTGFGEPVEMPSWRRPLGACLNPLTEAGLVFDHLLEPLPTETFRRRDPDRWARQMRRPNFLCVRARRPAAACPVSDPAPSPRGEPAL